MDYHKILKAYVAHVGEAEGVYLLSKDYIDNSSELRRLSLEELVYLRSLGGHSKEDDEDESEWP